MLLDTPVCDFGWKAPDFTLNDAYGNAFRMQEHLGEKGLLIAFICNHCPYVQRIAQHLAEDTAVLLKEGVKVLGIMPNDYHAYPDDAPKMMKRFIEEHNFAFPYLVDEHQTVAKKYGAVCTPDFFGFNAHGALQYRGRLDNLSTQTQGETPRIPELLHAMRLIAQSGSGPKEQIPSMGCSIKWQNG
jgi:peroxiredoxin